MPTLKILAFGDSLTVGYTCSGREETPYARALKRSLKKHGEDVEVVVNGLSGAEASGGDFMRRMGWICMFVQVDSYSVLIFGVEIVGWDWRGVMDL